MTKRVIAVVAGVAGVGGLLAGAAALGGTGGTPQAATATDYVRCMNTGQAGSLTTGLRANAKQNAAKHLVCGLYMATNL